MSSEREIVRDLYSSFAAGDVEAVLGALAPDVRWHEAEGGPYGGTFVGPQAVVENVFAKLATEWDGFAVVPEEILAEGSRVVAFGTYSGTYGATGKSFESPFAHSWTLRDGKVTEFRQYVDTFLHRQPME